MKKMISVLLVMSILWGCSLSVSIADDMGVQLLTAPDEETEPVQMDDMKPGDSVEISGFGTITVREWEFSDKRPSWLQWRDNCYDSSDQAEYLSIRIHILNIQKKSFDFKEKFGDVICDFGDGYQFGGWVRQEHGELTNRGVYGDDRHFEIGPLYDGYYDVVVTLPNYVVESKEPLSVTFSIGENEFTCIIRK